jgi:hypothetical protein
MCRILCAAIIVMLFAPPGFSDTHYSWVSASIFDPNLDCSVGNANNCLNPFQYDNDVRWFTFTQENDQYVVIRTLGYGGGSNILGNYVAPGGFEPVVAVYTSGGVAVTGPLEPGPAGGDCSVRYPDPNRLGLCQDVYAQFFLPAGTYTVSLSQAGNDSNGNVGDGFSHPFTPVLGSPECPDPFNAACSMTLEQLNNYTDSGGNGIPFNGTFGLMGTGSWALDISTAPEPGVALLTMTGLILVGIGVRRRRSRVS